MEKVKYFLLYFLLIVSACREDVAYVFTDGIRDHLSDQTVLDLLEALEKYDEIYGKSHAVIDLCNECKEHNTVTGDVVLGITENDTIKLEMAMQEFAAMVPNALTRIVLHERGHLTSGSKELNEGLIINGTEHKVIQGFTFKESADDHLMITLLEEAVVEYLSWHEGFRVSEIEKQVIGYYGTALLFQKLEERGLFSKRQIYDLRVRNDIDGLLTEIFGESEEIQVALDRLINGLVTMRIFHSLDIDSHRNFLSDALSNNEEISRIINEEIRSKIASSINNGNFDEEAIFKEMSLITRKAYTEFICSLVLKEMFSEHLTMQETMLLRMIYLFNYERDMRHDTPSNFEIPFF